MVSERTEFHLDGNGHGDIEVTETMEELKAATLRVDKLRDDGVLVSMGKQELSLLQKMLTAPESAKDMQVFLIADFMDEDEAHDHVAAYFEAKELGMDTDLNIAYIFAMCSTNRKGSKTNRVAMLLDALQHVKYTTNTQQDKKGDGYKSRSPLSA